MTELQSSYANILKNDNHVINGAQGGKHDIPKEESEGMHVL